MNERLDSNYLNRRASIDYNCHDELQMESIVDKIVDELKRRYGEDGVHLIGNESLRMLVKHW